MTKFARIAALAAVAAFVATPAYAAPVGANPAAKAKAKIVKPLTLTALSDLDLGTIVVGDLSGGAESVSLDRTNANLSCGSNLTCAATGTRGQYRITGTNNQTITVSSAAANLTNTSSGGNETLSFTPSAPATVALGNSGAAGVSFYVGGSLSISSTTVDGVYSGDMNVTVDY